MLNSQTMRAFIKVKKAINDGVQLDSIKGFMASGVSRYVYDLGNGYILKYQYDNGYHEDTNNKEYKLYQQSLQSNCSHLFAKIVYYDELYIIAEKCDITLAKLQREVDALAIRRQMERDIRYHLGIYLEDLHFNNIMRDSKGNYKAVDYAY